MNHLKGFFALLACAIIFASFSVFVRILSADFTPYQQIGFRNAIAFVIGLVAVIVSRQSFASLAKVPSKHVFAYTLTFPIAVIFYTLSVLEIKIITTIFGLYLGALLTSLVVGILFFKEKFTVLKLISLGLVLIGLIIYAYPFDGSLVSWGFLLALLSGVFDATANSFRKYLAGKVDRFVLVVLQMVGGLLVAGLLMFVTDQLVLPAISFNSWFVGGLFGLSLVAISYLTLVGFQNSDLNIGTIVLSSELFFASLLGLLFFSERVSTAELLGGTCIILATVLANLTVGENTFLGTIFKKLFAK